MGIYLGESRIPAYAGMIRFTGYSQAYARVGMAGSTMPRIS